MQDDRSLKTPRAHDPREADAGSTGTRDRPAAAPRSTDAEAGTRAAGTTSVTEADQARQGGDPVAPEPDLQPGPLHAADTNPAAPDRTAPPEPPESGTTTRSWIMGAIVVVAILALLAVLL